MHNRKYNNRYDSYAAVLIKYAKLAYYNTNRSLIFIRVKFHPFLRLFVRLS